MNNKIGFFIIMLLLMTVMNTACSAPGPHIQIEGFWVVQPPGVARGTAGYGIIKNTGNESDTLLKVSSDVGFVMLHKTDVVNGVGKMMHISQSVIKAGESLVLEPMSYHLMLSDMDDRIYNEGETATLTFEFEKSGIIKVEVPIKPSWQDK